MLTRLVLQKLHRKNSQGQAKYVVGMTANYSLSVQNICTRELSNKGMDQAVSGDYEKTLGNNITKLFFFSQ